MEVGMARKHEREMERRMAQSRPTYAKDVETDFGRLGGMSRSDLEPDDQRGAASPLGHGMGSKKMKEGGK
jgi:hypothetical protein